MVRGYEFVHPAIHSSIARGMSPANLLVSVLVTLFITAVGHCARDRAKTGVNCLRCRRMRQSKFLH